MRILLPILLLASPAFAAPFQDTIALDRAVAGFTGHPIGEEGGARTPVDARLRLVPCATVALAWRSETRDAVVVSCGEPVWRLFVAVGRAAPAPTPASAPVAAPVRLPPVIHRGDPVLVEANANGFSIAREGIAQGDAPPGARFLVKVEDARQPVQAIAVEAGRATLPGW